MFFALLAGLTLINARLNREFKIEGTWVALAAMPACIWLVLSGRISELALPGGMSIKMASLQTISIQEDGRKISPDLADSPEKGASSRIEQLKAEGTIALSFKLGSSYYNDSAIREYLTELPDLRYLIFTHADGSYAGFALAQPIRRQLEGSILLLADKIAAAETKEVPGFSRHCVTQNESRARALEIMDDYGLPVIPVIDEDHHFLGVLDRNRLTSSIVAALVKEAIKD